MVEQGVSLLIRQLIELNVHPHDTFEQLLVTTMAALDWLYALAARYGAHPLFQPLLEWNGNLLLADDPRDKIWVALDGRAALEELCRAASVQFTIDANPGDAIAVINQLWSSGLHTVDYPNADNWLRYLALSEAGYELERFGGPEGFSDLEDYVVRLSEFKVVMFRGQACRMKSDDLITREDIDLFLRSVWLNYRLRRYGHKLTVEIRPIARRHDASIVTAWDNVKSALSPLIAL